MKHLLLLIFMIPVTVFGQSQDKFVLFDGSGEVTNFKGFKVFQPLYKGYALANTLSDEKYNWYHGPVVLLHQEDKYFYDEEIIKTPEKSVERQIGVYRYETRQGIQKTVPIIEFEDKKSLSSSSETNKKRTKAIKVNSSIADEVNTINDYIRKHPDKEDKVKFLLNGIVEQLK